MLQSADNRLNVVRGLGLAAAASIVVGHMIGQGVFLKSRVMTCNVGTPGKVIAVWVFAGLLVMAGGLTFAELGTMMPRSGGTGSSTVTPVLRRHQYDRGSLPIPGSETRSNAEMEEMTRRRFLKGAVASGVSVPVASTLANVSALPRSRQLPRTQYQEMAAAARNFVGSLGPDLRAKAVFPFDGDERFRWHYLPHFHYSAASTFSRNGVSLGEMTNEQRIAAHSLLRSALSTQGYLKAAGIIALEDSLRDIEVAQGRDPNIASRVRSPENYFFSIFGDPARDEPWGWRADGHHLSLNFTSIDRELSSFTPAFMGTNPAVVRSGTHTGSSILLAEAALARQLLANLDAGQSSHAIFAATAPEEIVTGNSRKATLKKFVGIPAIDLKGSQRDLLTRLIEEYVNNLRPEFARAQLNRIRSVGIDKTHFAWAGSVEPGRPHYYRIHGPTLLIEYDNTQDNANHIHTVCRDLENDFGGDALINHYKKGHGHK
jgi:hypothetical protein